MTNDGLLSDSCTVKVSIKYDFKLSSGNFQALNGDWEHGLPSTGPGPDIYSNSAWGTKLNFNYSSLTESRLASPNFLMIGNENLVVEFLTWYNFSPSDTAEVHLCSANAVHCDLLKTLPSNSSGHMWTTHRKELPRQWNPSNKYLRFTFTSGPSGGPHGWFIREVYIGP